jgi:hypothetical protein
MDRFQSHKPVKMKKSILIVSFLCSIKCYSQQNMQSEKDQIMKIFTTYMSALFSANDENIQPDPAQKNDAP